MPTDCISFKDTGYFSEFICDYLDENEELKDLYSRFPKIEQFSDQIEEKQQSFSNVSRKVLVEVLEQQYEKIEASSATLNHIKLLGKNNTFTITTGHQLNLFTGPLYFLYKIISTINLSKQLEKAYPEFNFVPIYWMATEDHDFEEINYFNFRGKKIKWNRKASGAVGALDNKGLEAVFNLFSQELGLGKNADSLRAWFKKGYLEHKTLAEATRYIANSLFKDHGLVIIDGNSTDLKQMFSPYIKRELTEQLGFKSVMETNRAIEDIINKDYPIQVNPREINIFYLKDKLRERIVLEEEIYKVLNSDISWTKAEILEEVQGFPERFSPNVILRPLYQEVVLPNLCYIGGGGELAYWLQLKTSFKGNRVPFPMLLLRNSVLIKSQGQTEKLRRLNISDEDLFLKRDSFINKKVRQISNIDIDFKTQKQHLTAQFKALRQLAEQTDPSFLGAVAAQERKQLKGLEHLEKRLITAQKRKLKDEVSRMTAIQEELFPNGSLQERQLNFSELYLEYGDQLISKLIQELDPLKGKFSIISI